MSTTTGNGVLPAPGAKSIAGETVRRRRKDPKYGVMPSAAELKKFKDLGWTHAQIADHVFDRTGIRVTRNAVTMALRRAGLGGNVVRYEREIPWRVRQAHATSYVLTMLRALARRRSGRPLREELDARLDSWLAGVEDRSDPHAPLGWVVVYWPDTEAGFHLVPRRETDENSPIRRPEDDEKFAYYGGQID